MGAGPVLACAVPPPSFQPMFLLRSSSLGRAVALPAMVVVLLCGSCGPAPEPHRGPVVLITVDTLRSDVVGALGGPNGLTPHLDRLAADADWAQPVVSSSSWTVPAMASLMTGLQPWRHGNWHGERSRLSESHTTLAEAMKSVGYQTWAFRSNRWLVGKLGYAQGFDHFYDLGQRKRAHSVLSTLEGGADFVWLHVLPPHAPYVLRERFSQRLPALPADLPERLRPLDLEPFYDPERVMTVSERERLWSMYLFNVAYADEVVGGLLDALRESGHYDQSLVAVVSDHGEEFGENGQAVHGGSLHRALIEVPMILKLPQNELGASWARRLEPSAQRSSVSLYATLAELVGAAVPEGVVESLFSRPEHPALSELYLGNGVNQFSLVSDGEQLLWESRFAPAEPEYYAARLEQMGGTAQRASDESPETIFERLDRSFAQVLPLTGSGPPSVQLQAWNADGTLGEPRFDGATVRSRARSLRDVFAELNGAEQEPAERMLGDPGVELSPAERERLRALGYVALDRRPQLPAGRRLSSSPW